MALAPLTLSTFGYPTLRSATGEQVRLRTRNHFAVLIRLALAGGHSCSREGLIDMLWPSVPSKLSRHSLAQAVTVIKEKIGREYVLATRSGISLMKDAKNVDALSLSQEGVCIDGADRKST